jgi:hypothetical protein
MDKNLRDIVMAEAMDVRYWAEARATFGDADDLNGWCARASAELHRRLVKKGIASEIHMWWWDEDESAHVYCVVEDHIVDVTASQFHQFRNVPVVILHCREAEVYDFYQTKEVFKCADKLRKFQKKTKWPPEQVAFAA